MFTIDLLQAISDWQQGGSAEQKARRGQKLKCAAANLPLQFKSIKAPCFRRIALKKSAVWAIGTSAYLAESISAWSTSVEMCKLFKGGVPHETKPEKKSVCVIFEMPFPILSNSDIIINLADLFSNSEFQSYRDAHKSEIKGYELGMGKYGNTQNEVVIQCQSLPLSSICTYGGYPSGAFGDLALFPNGYWLRGPDAVKRISKKLLEYGNSLKEARDAAKNGPGANSP